MSAHLRRAILMMEAARPASGYKPETSAEWDRLTRTHEELGYAMYREAGMSEREARDLAQQTHGGVAGRLLLSIAFGEDGHG